LLLTLRTAAQGPLHGTPAPTTRKSGAHPTPKMRKSGACLGWGARRDRQDRFALIKRADGLGVSLARLFSGLLKEMIPFSLAGGRFLHCLHMQRIFSRQHSFPCSDTQDTANWEI